MQPNLHIHSRSNISALKQTDARPKHKHPVYFKKNKTVVGTTNSRDAEGVHPSHPSPSTIAR